MPAAVPILPCLPRTIDAGETVAFLVSDARFPSSAWTLAFVLNNGAGDAPITAAGVTSGAGFTVTLSPTVTASLAPGRWQWAEVFTAIGDATQVAYGRQGDVTVVANATVTQAKSTAQTMVDTLTAAIAKLSSATQLSVSFNGQSFTRANIGEMQKQLVYWQARVIAEQQASDRARGDCNDPGAIEFIFPRPRYIIGPYPQVQRL